MNARQLSLLEGRARRDAGRDKVASAHSAWLEMARLVAVRLCKDEGTVTSDDIRRAGFDLPLGAHVNLWGSLFNDPRFTHTDDFVQTARPKGHARWIRVWRLAR